jgi:hypothetical protein
MAAPVMAARGLFGLFTRIGVQQAEKAVVRGAAVAGSRAVANATAGKGAQAVANDAMQGVVRRQFGSYFSQFIPDAKASFKTLAFKDGIINTLKANWQHQLKHNMGGMLWGLGLPMAISLLTGFKGAWQAAVDEPNWLAKPFKFVNLVIPAAAGAAASVAYMALFPKAKGIPAMLMQNVAYGGGEFIAGNIVQKPKPALAPGMPPGNLTPEQQQQALIQQQINAIQQQQAEQLNKTMQSVQQITQPATPPYNPYASNNMAPANNALPLVYPPATGTTPALNATPQATGAIAPVNSVSPSIASTLGLSVPDANHLNQSLATNGGLSLDALMKSNGLG